MDNFDLKGYLSDNPLTKDNTIQEGINFLNELGFKFRLNEDLKPEVKKLAQIAATVGAGVEGTELEKDVKDIFNSLKGKSKEEIEKIFNQPESTSLEEDQEEESNTLMGKLRKFQRAGKTNLLPLVMSLALAWGSLGAPATGLALNALDGKATTEFVQDSNTIPDNLKVLDADDKDASAAKVTQDNKSIDDINDSETQSAEFIEYDYGSGKITDDIKQQLDDSFQSILDVSYGQSGTLKVKISGHSSNSTGTNSNISNTSDLPLDQERAESTLKYLKDRYGEKIGDVQIEYEIVDGSDYSDQEKVGKGDTDGAGALITLDTGDLYHQ